MAGAGLKNFSVEVLASNDVDQYLMQQTVMVFASDAARTSAFTAASLSPSEGMVAYLQDTNEIEVYNGSTWVPINNVTLSALSIDASGRVRHPLQPVFTAYTGGAYSSGTTVPFNNTRINRGNHYSTSTYRFTCPVSGIYLFHFYDIGGNTTTTYRWRLRKNDVELSSGGFAHQVRGVGTANYTDSTGAWIVEGAANDYFSVFFQSDSGAGSYGTPEYGHFQGMLIA